jgi:hypothetical protein
MPRRAKQAGFLLMLASFGGSILIMDSNWHRLMLAALGLTLAFFLWRVPVREVTDEGIDMTESGSRAS